MNVQARIRFLLWDSLGAGLARSVGGYGGPDFAQKLAPTQKGYEPGRLLIRFHDQGNRVKSASDPFGRN